MPSTDLLLESGERECIELVANPALLTAKVAQAKQFLQVPAPPPPGLPACVAPHADRRGGHEGGGGGALDQGWI